MKTKKHILYTFLIVITYLISFSQNCDTNSIKKLYQEANKLLSQDVAKSYDLALQAYSKSYDCLYSKYYFESVKSLCEAYYQKDQSDSIIKLLLPIISKLPTNTPTYYKAVIYHKISSAYTMMMQSENGLKYCLEALKNYEAIKDTANTANILVNIANVYQQQNNFKQADYYLRQAESKAKLISKKKSLGNVYNTMGILYAEHGQLDSALKFFLQSTSIREKLNDNTAIAWNYNNLGGLYVMLEKPKEAIIYLEKALKKFEETKNMEGQSSVANNLGELNMQIGNTKKAFEYYSYSRKLYSQTSNPANLENLYRNLSVYFDKMGDIKTAFKYSDSLIVLTDSLYGTRLDNSIAEMQTKYDVEKKDLELAKNKAEIKNEKNKRFITYGALAFFILLFSIAIWAFIQKRKNGRLLEIKNDQIETRNALLQNANQEISHQKEQLSEKQKEIVDSINYAKKIQTAFLASEEMLLENLVNHFILFKPKDIVSGDFTWATFVPSPSGRVGEGLFYIACCDSTGHGVPGAFMSLLNMGFLSEAIKERNILKPGEIFNYVRDRLIETIGKDEQQDGFDGIIICIDMSMSVRAEPRTITYAAANNSPLIIRNKEQIQLSCNKMPVGKGIKTDSFETFTLHYQKNDSLYLFTDGYPDQFGGPKGKKFKYKPLEELLLKNEPLSLEVQKEKLNTTFEDWKGNLEQVDDVCIIGIKL